MDDEDREAILRRRNRFMSVALAGIASLGCDEVVPQPCLSIAPPVEMHPEPNPEEMMEPTMEVEPTETTMVDSPEGQVDPTMVDPTMADPTMVTPRMVADMAPPMPCLAPPVNTDMNIPVRPRPRPCLSVAPRPRPCLSQIAPDPQPRMEVPVRPEPMPCLSVLPERIQEKPDDSEEA